jgi:hypothetical protein
MRLAQKSPAARADNQIVDWGSFAACLRLCPEGRQGDSEQAASELAAARGLLRHKTLSISSMKTHEYLPDPEPPPAIQALEDRTFFAGLRKTGMPEQ